MSARSRQLLLCATAAGVLALVTWLAREANHPDGVSYLDLATHARQGHWQSFLQGYWSPLYPGIIALVAMASGTASDSLVVVAHVINWMTTLVALIVIWRWSRRTTESRFGMQATAVFLLAGWGFPKVEAVTPDVLLLAIVTWLCYELIALSGERTLHIGLLLGAAYLTKTSCWPWLLLLAVLRWWGATNPAQRERVARSTLIAALCALAWILPLSWQSGGATLGSVARLNAEWYLRDNSSRLPDDDVAENRLYTAVATARSDSVIVAHFDNAAAWTYQPWGDPTAWSASVLSDTGRTPSVGTLLGYWLRNLWLVFGLWSFPLTLSVLLPLLLLRWRAWTPGALAAAPRSSVMVMMAGIGGMVQFAAVHAEPRLVAPFAAMTGLGFVSWNATLAPVNVASRFLRALHRLGGWPGIVTAAVFAALALSRARESGRNVAQIHEQLRNTIAQMDASGLSMSRIGIVGPAAPVLGAAQRVGAHIVLQVPPRSVAVIARMKPEEARATMLRIFQGRVDAVWQTLRDGQFQVLMIPKR